MSQAPLTDVRAGTEAGWPVGAAPADYRIARVRVIGPRSVGEETTVTVRDGRVAEVGGTAAGAEVDGRGLLLLPALVDLHSDALERERSPRPTAELPLDFALTSFEAKLSAAGIGTVFHGTAFYSQQVSGMVRSTARAQEMADLLDHSGGRGVDHRVLHRLDVRSEQGAALLRSRLDGLADADPAPLVSHEDHTPGQGQYTDRRHLEAHVAGMQQLSPEQARAHVDAVIERAEQTQTVAADALGWLGELARAGRIRLMGHDPDTADSVHALAARGGVCAEFPTTVEAARTSRELGLSVVAGAPNVLRGGSHSGNVSAAELVDLDLVDALASDYLPSGVLAAAFLLAAEGRTTLPRAVRMITSGPAAVAGLGDRGTVEPGQRADLLLVDDRERWPQVAARLVSTPA